MIQIAKIKKTGEVVQVVGEGERGYTMCLRKLSNKNKSGNRGELFSVKNENLQVEKQETYVI